MVNQRLARHGLDLDYVAGDDHVVTGRDDVPEGADDMSKAALDQRGLLVLPPFDRSPLLSLLDFGRERLLPPGADRDRAR